MRPAARRRCRGGVHGLYFDAGGSVADCEALPTDTTGCIRRVDDDERSMRILGNAIWNRKLPCSEAKGANSNP